MDPLNEVDSILRKWRNDDWSRAEEFDSSDFVSESRMVVIGGSARSGTTLLRVMLDSHPKVVVGPPTNIFIPTPIDAALLARQTNLPETRVGEAIASTPDIAELIETVRSLMLASSGKFLWGEKTARNVLMFEWIRRHFPNALLVHVIRDGRDVVCSLRTHRKNKIEEGSIVPTGNKLPLEPCAVRWVDNVAVGLAMRGYENYVEVRYEDLVMRPEATLRTLCDRLQIVFDPRMLAFDQEKGPLRDPMRFPQNVEATTPIYQKAMGRWRHDLSSADVQLVRPIIEPTLALLGYVENLGAHWS